MLYDRPETLPEALALLAGQPRTVLAGGTDLYPAAVDRPLPGPVLDITAVAGLRGITDRGSHWRIGACTTWSAVRTAVLPPAFAALQLAAAEVGGRQIQNAGTVAGNLCNASPAADSVPPLLALDAEVELASRAATRRLPLRDFLRGPRRTARAPDEILTAVLVPSAAATGRSTFLKLGARRHLVISIAMVAARLAVRDGRVRHAALAVGACSPVATRLPAIEARLAGARADAGLAARIDPADVAAALVPLDDVRGSADYRIEAATELLRRAVARLTEPPA
jgi:CO/xanthine dehydrogenase FAD-binding subunit